VCQKKKNRKTTKKPTIKKCGQRGGGGAGASPPTPLNTPLDVRYTKKISKYDHGQFEHNEWKADLVRDEMPASMEVQHPGRCANHQTLTQRTKVRHNRPIVRRQCLDVFLTYTSQTTGHNPSENTRPYDTKQESLANAKVSARQWFACERPWRSNLRQINARNIVLKSTFSGYNAVADDTGLLSFI